MGRSTRTQGRSCASPKPTRASGEDQGAGSRRRVTLAVPGVRPRRRVVGDSVASVTIRRRCSTRGCRCEEYESLIEELRRRASTSSSTTPEGSGREHRYVNAVELQAVGQAAADVAVFIDAHWQEGAALAGLVELLRRKAQAKAPHDVGLQHGVFRGPRGEVLKRVDLDDDEATSALLVPAPRQRELEGMEETEVSAVELLAGQVAHPSWPRRPRWLVVGCVGLEAALGDWAREIRRRPSGRDSSAGQAGRTGGRPGRPPSSAMGAVGDDPVPRAGPVAVSTRLFGGVGPHAPKVAKERSAKMAPPLGPEERGGTHLGEAGRPTPGEGAVRLPSRYRREGQPGEVAGEGSQRPVDRASGPAWGGSTRPPAQGPDDG